MTWPNMALTNQLDKTKIGLILKRENRREGEKRRRKEEEEEEEKKKRRRGKQSQKGMELHGILKFCMNFHAWMVIILSPNLGFC